MNGNEEHNWWTHWWVPLVQLLILLVGAGVGALRANGERGQPFQAAAHLYLGGLIVGSFACRWLPGHLLAAALSVLEVLCFFLLSR